MVIFHRFLYVYQGVNISYFLVLKKKHSFGASFRAPKKNNYWSLKIQFHETLAYCRMVPPSYKLVYKPH